jgi:hypothetical protein
VGRQVVLADVRLDLDDPPDAPVGPRPPLADQPRPDQACSRLERRARDELSEVVQWVA